jgi:transposase
MALIYYNNTLVYKANKNCFVGVLNKCEEKCSRNLSFTMFLPHFSSLKQYIPTIYTSVCEIPLKKPDKFIGFIRLLISTL